MATRGLSETAEKILNILVVAPKEIQALTDKTRAAELMWLYARNIEYTLESYKTALKVNVVVKHSGDEEAHVAIGGRRTDYEAHDFGDIEQHALDVAKQYKGYMLRLIAEEQK